MSGKNSIDKKKRMMSIESKQRIIDKYEQGERVSDIAREYGRNSSTICSILKQKETLKAMSPAKGIKIISRLRSSVHEQMENMLLVWITTQQLAGRELTQAMISQKAREIHNDLLQEISKTPTVTDDAKPFKASRGWYENFRKRNGLNLDTKHTQRELSETERYQKKFAALIVAEGYVPQQVFNCSETGLFWKRMPKRAYLTTEEMNMPGRKPMKDRLTLALCANASGDCKVEPLLVYHLENPRAFKSQKILEDRLQVMWRANPKGGVTKQFFVEWINLVFGPAVKNYLEGNELPLHALLILNNSPGHPQNLEDYILEEFQFIRVLFLPSSVTLALQPMDVQVISHFKKLYTKHLFLHCLDATENSEVTLREFWKEKFNILLCLKIIDEAWQSVSTRTLNCSWEKIWPESLCNDVTEQDTLVEEEILFLGRSLDLDIDENDLNELIREHSEELTIDELREQQTQEYVHVIREIKAEDETDEIDVIDTNEIKDMLRMWERISQFVERHHPDKLESGRASQMFDDTCLSHFRHILNGRKYHDSLLLKRSADSCSEIITNNAKFQRSQS